MVTPGGSFVPQLFPKVTGDEYTRYPGVKFFLQRIHGVEAVAVIVQLIVRKYDVRLLSLKNLPCVLQAEGGERMAGPVLQKGLHAFKNLRFIVDAEHPQAFQTGQSTGTAGGAGLMATGSAGGRHGHGNVESAAAADPRTDIDRVA